MPHRPYIPNLPGFHKASTLPVLCYLLVLHHKSLKTIDHFPYEERKRHKQTEVPKRSPIFEIDGLTETFVFSGELAPRAGEQEAYSCPSTTGTVQGGELAQPLTGCSTWERGPQTLTGQHSGAGSGGMGVGELALKA